MLSKRRQLNLGQPGKYSSAWWSKLHSVPLRAILKGTELKVGNLVQVLIDQETFDAKIERIDQEKVFLYLVKSKGKKSNKEKDKKAELLKEYHDLSERDSDRIPEIRYQQILQGQSNWKTFGEYLDWLNQSKKTEENMLDTLQSKQESKKEVKEEDNQDSDFSDTDSNCSYHSFSEYFWSMEHIYESEYGIIWNNELDKIGQDEEEPEEDIKENDDDSDYEEVWTRY
jgi:hypothetical protein